MIELADLKERFNISENRKSNQDGTSSRNEENQNSYSRIEEEDEDEN